MPFRFIQIPEHIETTGNPPSATTKWKAVGSISQSYVNAYALGATPAVASTIYGTLYRQDLRVRQVAYDQFTVEVPYGTRKNEQGQWTWDFDTTGGTVHITNAKEELRRYPTNLAPNQFGAIGVDGDQVHGTDIVIPALKINVTFRHPLGVITIPQAKYLSSITGTVNSDNFLDHAPGEVLFLGARGSDGTDAEASVQYQFATSANVTGLSIGEIAGISKRGWEAAWVRYEDAVEEADNKKYPIRKAKFVYVDRVYEEIPLATALGFGG